MPDLLRDLMDRYGDEPEKVIALVGAMGANAVEHLVPSLADEEGVYRTMAAQLLASIGDPRAVGPLIAALPAAGLRTEREFWSLSKKCRDGRPSWGCLYSSNQLMRAVEEVMAPLYRDVYLREVAEVRRHCAFALGKLGDARAVPPLRGLLGDRDPEIRRAAEHALMLLGAA